MELTANATWHPQLTDPSGLRASKPRQTGLTMVIDKGLGWSAFSDMLATAGEYIDIVKFGFGTSPLYPASLLRDKIELAKRSRIVVMPGGTLLESAVRQDVAPAFFRSVLAFGFTGVEISDGTIELSRAERDELIRTAAGLGLRVFTEYGKKKPGSRIDIRDLAETAERDLRAGAERVTVEARESGVGVGLFDEKGACRERELDLILQELPDTGKIIWEAPLKEQQVVLLHKIGPWANLGNIPVADVIALETMRRGLRSDTFALQRPVSDYVI
jgi:phosphosulfolactate synthase